MTAKRQRSTSDLDLPTVATAFGLAPDICAHDMIACLQKRIGDAVASAENELLQTLGMRSPVCGHRSGCRVTHKMGRQWLSSIDSQKCEACMERETTSSVILTELIRRIASFMEQYEVKPDWDGDLDQAMRRLGYVRAPEDEIEEESE